MPASPQEQLDRQAQPRGPSFSQNARRPVGAVLCAVFLIRSPKTGSPPEYRSQGAGLSRSMAGFSSCSPLGTGSTSAL